MIIKGKSRSAPRPLAAHLGNAEKNERVTLLETRGVIATDLRGALIEMDAYAAGTKSTKSLYHAAISPAPPHRLDDKQRGIAIDSLEAKLGLAGHARVVVMHEKLGREHIHVVWTRVDLRHMRTVSDSHNYRKHEEVARELERAFGHERVQGAHHERDGIARPGRTPSRAELRQEERTGIKAKLVREEITTLYRSSDNGASFAAALEERGYLLAQGDRRDFVIVDQSGGIHSLARRIADVKAAELRTFMSSVDQSQLPEVANAKHIASERKAREQEKIEARKQASLESSYAHGDGYVAQSQAAQREFEDRQKAINDNINSIRMFDYGDPDAPGGVEAAERRKRIAEYEADRAKRQARDGPSDRPKAPGGGRTRSR